jgi:uncharacterized protein (DUF2147 family)
MIKILAFAVATTTLTGTVRAQSTDPLAGVWMQDDGAATVRIGLCGNGPAQCGKVIAERRKPGESSLLDQTVAQNFLPKGKRAWKGQFVVDGSPMAASAKLISTDKMAIKICALPFLCETLRFNRVAG